MRKLWNLVGVLLVQHHESIARHNLCAGLEVEKAWLSAIYLAMAQVAPSNSLFTVWISLYYAGFYVVMTGLFALCIYVLMQTIDPYTPDYQDQLKSPGKHWEGFGNALGATYSRP